MYEGETKKRDTKGFKREVEVEVEVEVDVDVDAGKARDRRFSRDFH